MAITFLSGYVCSDVFRHVVTDINYVDRGAADPRRCSTVNYVILGHIPSKKKTLY